MTSATLAPVYGYCCTCGHFGYLLFTSHICQDCYWSERDFTEAAVPPYSEDFDIVILNHYRG
jgi:hypothetical protein